ncbi:hypothetical protein GmHk_13G036181 [Glycine max]|nr:hypothetical protein GmHk_13G036181 [Glycine max]KAH1214927.1 hypothetical protein GmHk_13G036181 [Glycine max]KAH1214928.1 hypothetical protein GmHk_13G036181 [Glycine max]
MLCLLHTPLPEEPTIHQLQCKCRAYIMHMIGGALIPDKSGNIVHLIKPVLRTVLGIIGGWKSLGFRLEHKGIPHGDLVGYRSRIDHMENQQLSFNSLGSLLRALGGLGGATHHLFFSSLRIVQLEKFGGGN